jgi:hypothetical protein
MWPVDVWRWGRLRGAGLIAMRAGAVFGLLQLALGTSVGRAVASALLFGIFFGVLMSYSAWRKWPGAADLVSADRVAVARAVRRGEDVDDRRLASAVVEYVGVVRNSCKEDRRYEWFVWLVAASTLVIAIVATIDQSTRHAAGWWGLVVVWAVLLALGPRRRRRSMLNASRAEYAARSHLGDQSTSGTPSP